MPEKNDDWNEQWWETPLIIQYCDMKNIVGIRTMRAVYDLDIIIEIWNCEDWWLRGEAIRQWLVLLLWRGGNWPIIDALIVEETIVTDWWEWNEVLWEENC